MNGNRTPWPKVALLCATATASYICRVNVSTAGAMLMPEFGLSQAAMGRVFSAFLLGYALFQIPAGALADRWGAGRVLSLAAWLWAGITVLQSCIGWGPLASTTSTALAAFILLRFLLGVSEAPTYPGAGQGIARWVPPVHQGRANGIVIASIGLGSAMAPPLVSNIMVRWGWRASLLVSALPAVAVGLLWLRAGPAPPVAGRVLPEPGQPAASARGNLRTASFALLTVSYTLQGYVGYIFVTWFYLYLVQERNFDLLSGAWMSSLPWILSIISIPLGGLVSDRLASGVLGPTWGRRAVPLFGLGLSGVFIAVGAHTASPVVAAVSLALATALVLCVEGPFWATMMRIAGPGSGTAGGIMNMGSNLGGMVSPALTPLLAVYVGWENALHLAALLAVAAGLLWFGIQPEQSGAAVPQELSAGGKC